MTAEFFAQSSEAANVDLWPVRSSSSALPGGARGAFTMAVLRRRTWAAATTSSRSGHFVWNLERVARAQNDVVKAL